MRGMVARTLPGRPVAYDSGMVFLGAFLAATAALLLGGTAPFRPAGALLAWVVFGGVSWWYVRATFSQVQSVAQPAGYGFEFGALLGAFAQIVAFAIRIAFGRTAVFAWPPDVWAIVASAGGVGAAALLGGLGGLVAALQVPKAAETSQGWLVSAGVAVAVACVATTGIVFYVVTLAKAMSDVPG